MGFLSVFDVIGPNMVGPSSSHTAGAVRISLLARKMLTGKIKKAKFVLYGSFANTYRGHGTDRALLGGIMNFQTDDLRIRDSFNLAKEAGIEYSFEINTNEKDVHPNTADIILTNENDFQIAVRGESLGGGKVRISEINKVKVDFNGEYSTLIVIHKDTKGVMAHITKVLSEHDVNIAFMKLFREEKGGTSYAIVESDEKIPKDVMSEIQKNKSVVKSMLVEI
ncbi:L-serine ammonia-lyase, iron-sulfur-dependent subunit beta [Fusobacterium sp. PH5-44]|uniref:L-serine ammonia-lyase, iron-sulfur-dependent subunit beta n=1 Tax=unclassified Fusobacterium TaxID=2648384 RepID=UPI003D236805